MSDDLSDLGAELVARIGELAECLVGEPPNRAMSTGRTLRFYAHGGLGVEVAGAKRGSWYSHSASEGGGPLQLIMHMRRCSMGDAIQWARDWTGQRESVSPRPAPVPPPDDAEEAADKARRIGIARDLWAASTPLDGTTAERYLTATRGIPRPLAGWPWVTRFHAPSGSLIVAATATGGAVQAVQRVRLTPDAAKADGGTGHQPTKQTNGVLDGAAVRLPGPDDGPVLLAEGPETGFSVWVATGMPTLIALGSISNLEPPAGRPVVLCRDDDKPWSPADRKLRRIIKEWREAGINLRIATPWPERRCDGSDFNDTIGAGGAAAVRERIEAALAPATSAHRLPVAEARRALDDAIGRFFAAAVAHDAEGNQPPPVHAIRVDVGTGKSTIARRHAAEMIAAMRDRGDRRTVVIAVPTHKLGEEQAAAFERLPVVRAAGLTAAVWRGREAPDPNAPGETMCRNLDAVRDATSIAVSVQSAVCKRNLPDGPVKCPFFDVCGYQRQREREADLWIVAHECLFQERPSAIGDVAAIVVDESAWQDGLEGAGDPIILALDTLQAADPVPGNPINTERLAFLRRRVFDALHGMTDGPVTREALAVTGLTREAAAEARTLEWRRKVDPEMHPAMTAAERKEAVAAAKGNRTVVRLALFWRAAEALLDDGGPEASGWAALALEGTREGHVRVLRLKGRKPIREGWQAPTLLIDAVLNIDLARWYWPDATLTADVAAEAPHQRIRQVTDASFSKRRLLPSPFAAQTVRRAGARNMRELHAAIAAIGRAYAPGLVLAVAQKDVEEALPILGTLPPNVQSAHHNAVAGRDGWRDVAALVVVGRTAPPPADVERIAEALTGRAVEPLAGWYQRAVTGREMADGSAAEAEADRHPDPVAEAIRWQICEGELIQIIGRGRGVNRTEADPVDVLVLTDVPLPLPVHAALGLADLASTPDDLMLAADGIAFENPTDAATAYPALWGTRAAAKQALARPRLVPNPYKDSLIRESYQPPILRLDYQLSGPGKKPAGARSIPAAGA